MEKIRSSNPTVVTGSCDHKNTQARHHQSLKLGTKLKYFKTLTPSYVIQVGQKKNIVSGNAGDEKNLHPGSHKFLYIYRISKNILFSSLVSFAFDVFLLFCLFFEIKNIYSDTHSAMREGE